MKYWTTSYIFTLASVYFRKKQCTVRKLPECVSWNAAKPLIPYRTRVNTCIWFVHICWKLFRFIRVICISTYITCTLIIQQISLYRICYMELWFNIYDITPFRIFVEDVTHLQSCRSLTILTCALWVSINKIGKNSILPNNRQNNCFYMEYETLKMTGLEVI